jgi:arsenite methyltransferase
VAAVGHTLGGDAESLPLGDASFDVVLCECSLCTFPDKQRAAAEMRRVLRPGGAAIVSDVTARIDNLPLSLRSFAARVACLADALDATAYVRLLERDGFDVVAHEKHDSDLAEMVDRLGARLRVGRMLFDLEEPLAPVLDGAVDLASVARVAIERGDLGYTVFVGTVPA